MLDRNYDAGARPGVFGKLQHFLGVGCFSTAGMGADRCSRFQIDVRAFRDRAISVVKCMVEFHQLRHPVADSDQSASFDIGLSVVEAGLSVQDSALTGALDAVLALPDDGAGIG